MSGDRKLGRGHADHVRRDRLGAALRENLRRRKDQARARRPGDPAPSDDPAPTVDAPDPDLNSTR